MSKQSNLVELATELSAAWLGNPSTHATAHSAREFIHSAYKALAALSSHDPSEVPASEPETFVPAVSVRRSLASPDHILSLIDGKPYRTLRRHLSAQGLTPDAYRTRYGLKPDYPLVAPSYAERRRQIAKSSGLGRNLKMRSPTESRAEEAGAG
jgi:predicted transcriptional regulator